MSQLSAPFPPFFISWLLRISNRYNLKIARRCNVNDGVFGICCKLVRKEYITSKVHAFHRYRIE